MENIINSILSKLDDQSLQSISQKTNTSPSQAKSALANAIPILMNVMAKNNQNPEKAASLQKAVEKDHDGKILDNLGSYFNNPDSANGPGIVKHVLGTDHRNAVEYITKDSGVSESSATRILEIAAPLVMGFLGKNCRDGFDVGNLLNAYIQNQKQENPQSQSLMNKLFDMEDEGKMMDDLKEMGKSFLGK